MADVLDRIVIAPVVVAAWRYTCQVAASRATWSPEDLGDEQAEAQADGSLRVFVERRSQPGVALIEMRVPAKQWAWSH